MNPRLIGIKRKPCEVSQIPNGTSLNSDIMFNKLKMNSQRKKNGDARETIWRHEAKQGKTKLDMPVDVEITLTSNHNKTKVSQ